MKLEFTPALELAFDRARQFAACANLSEVMPRHLLQGILAEEEGKGVALLIQAGTDWPRLQAHLGLPAADSAETDPSHVMLHDSCRDILRNAGDLARHHGDEGSIATDHVLLALLTLDEYLRTELEAFGLNLDRLRPEVIGDEAPLVMDVPLMLHEPIEQVHTGRILDANANRAREALRVLEDYARFVLNDAFLSEKLKELRHDFAQALRLLPMAMLLDARDTQHDVGAAISTDQEWQRPDLRAVVQANAKRLQEALRSLEEYGKVVETAFAQNIEKIRYRSYSLEAPLMQGGASRERLADARLCVLVTEEKCRASLSGTVKEALLGGAQVIQLREKELDDRALLKHAHAVRQLTRAHGALFIVNDRADIALLADADGVHLGQDDLPVREARSLLGASAIIGVSTHNLDQVRQAVLDGANYIGVGPTASRRRRRTSMSWPGWSL